MLDAYRSECREVGRAPTEQGAIAYAKAHRRARAGRPLGVDDFGDGTDVLTDLRRAVAVGRRFPTIVLLTPPIWPRPDGSSSGWADPATLPVADLAAEDSQLHVLAQPAQVPRAFGLLDAWGFSYRSTLAWPRRGDARGALWRSAHEMLLSGVRGDGAIVQPGRRSWMPLKGEDAEDPLGRVLAAVQEVGPAPRLLLFADRLRDGWACWGPAIDELLGGPSTGEESR